MRAIEEFTFFLCEQFFFSFEIQAMTRALEYEIKSVECHIENAENILIEQRVKYFEENMVFKPSSMEYNEANHHYMLTVDFKKAE